MITLLLLSACGNKDADTSDTTASSAVLATYNTGLAVNFVPYAEERRDAVAEAVAGLDADVVCLQEVWQDEDIDAILAATADTFPNSYYEKTEEAAGEGTEASCTEEETTPLKDCALDNCADSEDLTGCVFTYCSGEFDKLSDECKECAAANIGLEDIEAIVEACLTGSAAYSWGGHNGLLLLSRDTLADTELLMMESWLVQRAALYARAGEVQVACTHLAADLPEPDYTSDFASSYEEEQAQQITTLLAWMEDRIGTEPAALLGDFNTGPELSGGITAELPANWQLLVDAGWADANVDQADPFCTWCPDNTLQSGADAKTIDHILLRNSTGSEPLRLLDTTAAIETDAGTEQMPLSDHYGMSSRSSW